MSTTRARPGADDPAPAGSDAHRRLPRFAPAGLFGACGVRRRRRFSVAHRLQPRAPSCYARRRSARSSCTSASRCGRGHAQGHRPAGDLRGHHRVPRRHGPAGLAGLDGAEPRPRPVRRASSSPTRCAASSARAAARYHAIVGTLIITGAHRADLGPDRPAHRHLPRGVRPREADAGDHVLRRRHDRHPVDRRRPVRLRAVRAVLRPGRPDGLHGRGRARRCS